MKCKFCGKEFLSYEGNTCPHCGHEQTNSIEGVKKIVATVSGAKEQGEYHKGWIFVLIGLIIIMLLWFSPSQALTGEAIEDISKNSSSEMIELYEESIPSVYNLMFGGTKTLEIGSKEYNLDYSKLNITISTLEWIFWLHLLSIVLSFICIFEPAKVTKSLLIVLLGVCAIGFFTVITNSASDMLSALNVLFGGSYTKSEFLTLGFGGWAPIFIYIIITSIGIHFYNEE